MFTRLFDATALLDTIVTVLPVGGKNAHHHLGGPLQSTPDRPQESSRSVIGQFYPR